MTCQSAARRAAVVVVLASAFMALSGLAPGPGRAQDAAPPSRERVVTVEVVDAKGIPVADAPVEAIGGYRPLVSSKTNDHGLAVLRLQSEQPVQWIVALRSHKGLDY